MRALLSIAAMLTIAPVLAVTTLVCWNPDRWGGSLNPLNILVMSFFGLFTVKLWPTYIPAIVLTPFLMSRVSTRDSFRTLPLPLLLTFSLLIGAVAGVCVLGYVVLLALSDSTELALN